ncbi:TetR family transcriptional regulator [Tsukamurella sp. 8F]|uniref:TetR/AcrR family transcriptional regulator n=1 Tax=unclassified Tsukamurella TaxID=2633480 RepID=UPI0023B8AB69|nr:MULTISPECIES: TetR/AcrR family transcriptional regulator [unclassified Tsukamurella]MDF0532552.1 TetR family transcriptional regulator [Tsukamurella sp. 8J]MDF0589485.1 TetR family transcriptional regulator [Tsukamurella sp. 8F]
MAEVKAGRPARLSRELIVETALSCDLSTLTMRELAQRLGVSHSALYRWVAHRQALFDLISEVMVERIVPSDEPTVDNWRTWLARLAWAAHDEFLAVPGYAMHVAAPHTHNEQSFGHLRERVVHAFRLAGASEAMAEQSWHVFGISVVTWLGAAQAGVDAGPGRPRFELFLDTLLRGLPTREPVEYPR